MTKAEFINKWGQVYINSDDLKFPDTKPEFIAELDSVIESEIQKQNMVEQAFEAGINFFQDSFNCEPKVTKEGVKSLFHQWFENFKSINNG